MHLINAAINVAVILSMFFNAIAPVFLQERSVTNPGYADSSEIYSPAFQEPMFTATPLVSDASTPVAPLTQTPTNIPPTDETPTIAQTPALMTPTLTPSVMPTVIQTSTPTNTQTPTPEATISISATPTASVTPSSQPTNLPFKLFVSSSYQSLTPGSLINLTWNIENWEQSTEKDGLKLQITLPNVLEIENPPAGTVDPQTGRFTMPVNEKTGALTLKVTGSIEDEVVVPFALLKSETIIDTDEIDLGGNPDRPIKVEKTGKKIKSWNNHVKVTFPSGALDEDANVWIRPVRSGAPEINVGNAFEVVAEGLVSKKEIHKFKKSITIQVAYPDQGLAGNEASLVLFYYDEQLSDWVPLPSWVDTEANLVYGRSDHLTVFNYNIHTMDLAKLPSLRNFQTSQFTGAATYSYPIELPAGPGGSQPSLALTYNSQVVDGASESSQASWVGMGWSLSTGSITRNMNGTSDYLGDDTFSLTIGTFSSQLVPGADGYYHTQEESYWRIYRDTVNDTWTVWDKEGNKFSFGTSYPSFVYTNPKTGLPSDLPYELAAWFPAKQFSKADYPTYEYEPCTSLKGQTAWVYPLVTAENKFSVSYTYSYYYDTKPVQVDTGSDSCDKSQRRFASAVYPQSIIYPNQRYRIHFELEDRADFNGVWNDLHSRVEFSKRRLKTIKIEHDADGNGTYEQVIKKYVFTYAPTGSSVLPGVVWSAGNVSGLTATLTQIQEYGLNEAANLPATTLFYEDQMHLTKANNGYGGEVRFTYESTPWYYTDAGASASFYTSFPDNINADEGSWGGNIIFPTYNGGNARIGPGEAYRWFNPSYYSNYLHPGQAYRIGIALNTAGTTGSVQVGLSNGSTWSDYRTGPDGILILPMDAGNVRALAKCDNCSVTAVNIRPLLTRYRVTQTTLSDSITNKSYAFAYSYEGPKTNLPGSYNGVCPAINRNLLDTKAQPSTIDYRQCMTEAYSEFLGHSKVTETGPDGRNTITSFFQDYYKLGKVSQVDVVGANGIRFSSILSTYKTEMGSINQDPNVFPHPKVSSLPIYTDLYIAWTYLSSEEKYIYDSSDSLVGRTLREYYYNKNMQGGVQYGNVTEIADFDNTNGAKTGYTYTRTSYYPNATFPTYIVGLPASSTLYQCPSDNCESLIGNTQTNLNSLMLTSTWFIYDSDSTNTSNVMNLAPSKGKLTARRVLIRRDTSDIPWYSDETYEYDTWGNRVKTTVYSDEGDIDQSTPGQTKARFRGIGHYTRTCFGAFSGTTNAPDCLDDGYNTYPAWQRDAEGGQVIRWEYDKARGVPTKEISPNGSVTIAVYDEFSRIKTLRRPGDESGKVTLSVAYDDFTASRNMPFKVYLEQKITETSVHAERRFYDGLGRLIQMQTANAVLQNGTQDVITDYAYDAYDNLIKQTYPYDIAQYASGETFREQQLDSQPATTMQYDGLNRLTLTAFPDLTSTLNEYIGLKTRTTDQKGYTTTTYMDVWGHVTRVEPQAGLAVDYIYDRSGHLQSTKQGGITTTMTYDKAGRKTSITDPDMGAWSYAYDPSGNLTRQTDALGQSTCMYYDSVSRLTAKHYQTGNNCPLASGAIIPRDVAYGYDGDFAAEYFDSSTIPYGWTVSPTATTKVVFSGGQAKITGDGISLNQRLTRTDATINDDRKVRFSFMLDSSTASGLLALTYGASTTYRRYGIEVTGGNINRTYTTGSGTVSSKLLTLRPGVWYEAVIGINGYSQSRVAVWERDNPSAKAEFVDTLAWPGLTWQYKAVMTTGVLSLDNYHEQNGKQYGNRTLMADSSGSTYWYYDARGRVLQENKSISGSGFVSQWTYFSNDAVASMTYPADASWNPGEKVNFSYHPQEVLNSVSTTNPTTGTFYYTYSTQYDAAQRIVAQQLTNQAAVSTFIYYPWNNQGYPNNYKGGALMKANVAPWGTAGNAYLDLTYTYDKNGNITFIGDARVPQTLTFTYDTFNRLATVSGAVNETYTYDSSLGRLATKGGVSLYYTGTHPHAVTSLSTGTIYNYDANGNMTTRGADTYEYDAENRLVTVKTGATVKATFVYDGNGNRVKGTVNGVTTTYIGNYFEWTGSTATMKKYYYAGSSRVAMREGSGIGNVGLKYLLTDHLGSTTLIADPAASPAGALYGELRYKPFGETRYTSGTIPTTFRYTGQRAEPDLGIYYYGARWYDPYITQFTQPDSIIPDPYNPLDWNRYAYVRFNPINATDPSGHCYKMVGSKLAPECASRWQAYSSGMQKNLFAEYHITLSSSGASWGESDKAAFAVAVPAIGNSMAVVDPYKRSASDVFVAEYGDLTFTARPSTDGIHYSCGYEQGGFGCYGGSGKVDAGLVAHELGHTFSNNNGRQPYTDILNASESDYVGNHIFGSFGNGYERTTRGFKGGGPPYMYHGPVLYPNDWDNYSNPNVRPENEDLADTFTNWVFGTFDYSGNAYGAGDIRNDWMTTNMVEWLR